MRFSAITSIAIAAATFFTGGQAAPYEVAKRSTSVGQAYAVVQNMNGQVQAAAAALKPVLAGAITPAGKATASTQASQQIAKLTVAMGQAIQNITHPAASHRRQADVPTADLINAIGALTTNIDNLLISIISSTGNPALIGPAVTFISTVSTLILSTAAVVVDILPFLGMIGQFLSGIGSIISGVGSIIPKGA